jgi:hypothetical protein
MDSFTFRRGKAWFSSDSLTPPWAVVFEDEGPSGQLYAFDRTRDGDDAILDAMLIYNNGAGQDLEREYLASVQWSRDGTECVFYVEGSAQAYCNFVTRVSFCRANFPNFLDDSGRPGGWRASSHAWEDATIARFEAELYAE